MERRHSICILAPNPSKYEIMQIVCRVMPNPPKYQIMRIVSAALARVS